jgi:3-hydroxybutyryl-CoA dehydratase
MGEDGHPSAPDACPFIMGETQVLAYVFTLDAIRTFAEETGDENPLHRDETHARASRYGRLIACAGHSTSIMMGVLATFLSRKAFCVGRDFSFSLRNAVRADMATEVRWMIDIIEPRSQPGQFHIHLKGTLTDLDGTPLIDARCRALVIAV